MKTRADQRRNRLGRFVLSGLCCFGVFAFIPTGSVSTAAHTQAATQDVSGLIVDELFDEEVEKFTSYYGSLTPEQAEVFDRMAALMAEGKRGLFGLFLAEADPQVADKFLILFGSFNSAEFDYAAGTFSKRDSNLWFAVTNLLASENIAEIRPEFLEDDYLRCQSGPSGTVIGSEVSDANAQAARSPCSEAVNRFREESLLATPAVTRGIELSPRSAPWQAQLSLFGASTRASHTSERREQQVAQFGRELNDWEINHTCGAVYIGGKFLLTAAHCIGGLQSARFFAGRRIRLGTHQIDGLHNLVRIRTVLTHRQYDPVTLQNDIALIELEREPDFPRLSSVRLPSSSNYRPGSGDLLLSGWGYRRETTNASNALASDGQFQDRAVAKLQGGLLRLYATSVCNNNAAFRAARVHLRTGQLCAGTAIGIDSCRGDSGGPLVEMDTGILIGIVSGGKGCGLEKTPGIYVDVAHYLDWIERAKLAAPGLNAKKKYTFR